MNKPHVLLKWVALLAVAAGIVLTVYVSQTQIDRDLQDMPEADRRALYQRTLEVVRACASHTAPSLAEPCRAEAELLRHFAECERDCRQLSQSVWRASR